GLGLQRVLTLVDERVQCPFGPEVAEMAAHSDRLPAERARTPEPAEDLPPDGVVPVAEGPADGERVGCPRAASQHLVLGAEEDLRVLPVGEGPEARVDRKSTRLN